MPTRSRGSRSRCSASRPPSGSSSIPRTPTTTRTTRCCGGATCSTCSCPDFEGFRVPTEHPLAIAAGALLSLFGSFGDRLFIALILASFLWLIWGVYKLGRVSFTPLVGGVAALLVLTRFDFGFLAARGYIDIPYMAMVVWAAALEADRPRRGVPVFVVLGAAGLLRPEAWVLAGLYWLWMAWQATWRRADRATPRWPRSARSCGRWSTLSVTGDPLFSLLLHERSAEDLGRQRTRRRAARRGPGRSSPSIVKCRCWPPR